MARPAAALAWTWSQLRRGAADRRSTFHTPTLTTVDAAGLPCPRTVVLQHACEQEAVLICHTHRAAAKVRQLQAQPVATWHVYDRGHKVQVLLRGETTVHVDGPLFEERWAATRPFSRVCYTRLDPPGRPRISADRAASDDDGRGQFAVVQTCIQQVDWLYLRAGGHVGYRFEPGGENAEWRGEAMTT